ncbi:hypothetical protein ABT052_01360 [Streptomyces sp. NPDC002766]|uniref:hypothetical protein n=1 Tax=Streptomyces sp. NPDC002766 TaxID=3154429 RepID=UPI003328F349
MNPIRNRSRAAGACLLAVGLALTAGSCARPDVRSGGGPLRLCGVDFPRGADAIGATPLGTSTRGMPPAPAGGSRLPARTATPLGVIRIVAVSHDCHHGRTVVVTPASAVRVDAVARDRAGRVVALELVTAWSGTTTRVHVYAYDGGRPVGQLRTTVG